VKLPRPSFLRSGFLSSRRVIAAVAAVLLVLFLFRPGVRHLRYRIAGSIGSALGRRVELDDVRLRLLPRPGFDLEGLVIYDDPAFSAEPMIRAQEVSAAIRLRSLFRGRIEIATLSATEPSINLVRNDLGRWNLASLIERNAQIPVAPTGKPAYEPRPAFPYLEADHARINFKIGQIKKSYALMDADVALWQDSENSWGARIKAEPVRTDFNLTDTGLLQLNATWQRASSLRVTPLQITALWQQGQLGQITKLLSGRDRGWRGGVSVSAKLSGTPEALRIESETAIERFHRYDIVERENVRLTANCSGQYDAVAGMVTGLLCESPVGEGTLRLRGETFLMADPPAYDLTIEATKVPVSSMVRLLRQAKQQIPGDLAATGLLNAEFRATRSTPEAMQQVIVSRRSAPAFGSLWSGTGSLSNVRLVSHSANAVGGQDQLTFSTIPLALVSTTAAIGNLPAASQRFDKRKETKDDEPAGPHLRIGPAPLKVNSAAPVNVGGWLSSASYRFFLRGELEIKDLFGVENVMALPIARPPAQGSASLDVSVSGPWQGFTGPVALGTAQLRNVRAAIRGLNEPLEIVSATIALSPEAVSMEKISARIGSTHWSGEASSPRHCTAPSTATSAISNTTPDFGSAAPSCIFQFDLTADQLTSGDLVAWLTPHPAKRPWYLILNSDSKSPAGPSPLLAVRAHGSLHIGQLGLKKLAVTQLVTKVELDGKKIALTGLRAQVLQGTHQGNWTIDLLSGNPSAGDVSSGDPSPTNASASVADNDVSKSDASAHGIHYHGSGTLNGISLAQAATLMDDDWIDGKADGNFELDGSGDSFRELLRRSDARLQFVLRNGSLPHVEIPGSTAPLPVHRFEGDLRLQQGSWKLSSGKLESRDGIYQISGTASANGGLDVVLTRGDEQSWTLTGTLAKPHIIPGSRTVAKSDANAKTVKP
jgi:hypothetical protein